MDAFEVSAFGLRYRSTLPCPGIPQTPFPGAADVTVGLGALPADLGAEAVKGHRFEARPQRLLLRTNFIADYLVEDGRSIRLLPKPGARGPEIANLVFGWATGGLLIQRGTLALHAATVATPGGAVAFCGDSGVGKSTLVTLLMQRGLRVIDDNLAALDFRSGAIQVQPGLGSVRLTPDSLALLGRPASGLAALSPQKAKYLLPLAEAERCRTPLPLRRIYVLQRAAAPSRRSLAPAEKLAQLQKHTFVGRFAPGLQQVDVLFRHWLQLAQATRLDALAVPLDRSAQQWADEMAAELLAA